MYYYSTYMKINDKVIEKISLSNVLTYVLPIFLGLQDVFIQVQTVSENIGLDLPKNLRLIVAGGSIFVGFGIKVIKLIRDTK